jgi:hypothetical protein
LEGNILIMSVLRKEALKAFFLSITDRILYTRNIKFN